VDLTVSGLPAIAIATAFIVAFAAPVWLAARVAGADYSTLKRSVLALMLGLIGTIVTAQEFGVLVFVLAPVFFFLAFKFLLGTPAVGAAVLGVLAIAGYIVMVKIGGAAFSLAGISLRP
jgi:hypothetical protein